MFYSCLKLRYYLFAKTFTLLTDHNNLLWMESSETPKIIRMRIFLQGFNFRVTHVKGKDNVFADWLSRMYDERQSVSTESAEMLLVLESDSELISSFLSNVHNQRMGHHGAQRTWSLLNKHYPGHGISMSAVQEFVKECAFCQKVRATMAASIPAPTRAIASDHPRHLCGYDTLYITPADAEGFQYLHVFKLIPSRLLALYPSKTLNAESLASAAFQFFVTYGITDVLITDPGSNINSEVVKLLLQWFGIRLRMSITGRHQSNMVERSHREILKHLTLLVNAEGLRKIWSKPHVIGIIQFILNSERSAETGVSPFEYVFGSADLKHFIMPETDLPGTVSQYLNALNNDLRTVRQAARQVQEKVQATRMGDEITNTYVTGDLILFDESSRGRREEKLKPRYSGPYIITSVHKADVTCSHIVTGKSRTIHMEHVKPFFGSKAEAFQAAKVDDQQHLIVRILDYRGEPEKRSTMFFLVEFEENDVLWLDYNADLAASKPFELYCLGLPQLEPLLYTERAWRTRKASLNAAGVVGVVLGDSCYVDLRAWGPGYYHSLKLPMGHRYVVLCTYLKWTDKRRRKVDVRCQLFDTVFEWNATDVRLYGLSLVLEDTMVLVDEKFCEEFPGVKG